MSHAVKLHLNYFTEKTRIAVGNQTVEVKPFQIIVWVSVSLEGISAWDPRTPRIPAILDTGNNHNFAVTQEHLAKWAGIESASLEELGRIREAGRRVHLRGASLWLHTDGDPFKLTAEKGIAVYEGDWPRLPTLGLRALTNSKLQIFIYGDTKQVIIRTPPPWYWPF